VVVELALKFPHDLDTSRQLIIEVESLKEVSILEASLKSEDLPYFFVDE
jgi:hypothetical protein